MRTESTHAAYMRLWRQRNPDHARAYDHKKYWEMGYREKQLQRQKLRNQQVKQQVFVHYAASGTIECVCCHERQLTVLTLHHVNRDGGKHRKMIMDRPWFRGGLVFYLWLIKHNFPQVPELQILCHNCHQAKTHNDFCPHERVSNQG